MDDGDEAVPAARVVVIAGGERGHDGPELVGEGGLLGGGAEADLGVDGERRQALARLVRAAGKLADLAHHARGERDQVAGRQAIGARRSVAAAPSAAGDTT